MNTVKIVTTVKIEQHIDGDLKGFYVANLAEINGHIMKSKTLSTLLAKISKYYRGQGN